MKAYLKRLAARAFAAPQDAKASRAGALIALHAIGRPRWTPRDYAALAREGYERNAIVHRCVRMIAEAAAAIPWRLMEGRDEVVDHPLAAMIARPNAREAGQVFFETLYGHLLVSGNAYVEAVSVDGAMREWHALRPDRIEITPGSDGWPEAYDYVVGAQRIRFAMNGDGAAPILHLKLFNPLDDHYGFSPIAAAQVALDLHNAAGQWNKALLDNAARPSGALVYQGAQGHLSEEQFARLKAELEENFEGPRNAGRPLLLEGGLDWKSLSLTPKDMDFVEARASAAREIALAFGIPPMILGLPGDNTYSNYREANLAFWRQTIIPLVQRTQKSFEAWLAPLWPDMRIDYDLDRLDALAEERTREWARIDAASFLTEDEKREALGFGARPQRHKEAGDAETGPVWNRDQPRVPAGSPQGGQWTSGGGEGGLDGLIHLAGGEGIDRYKVDLWEEEERGGHTIARHVGKTDAELLEQMAAGWRRTRLGNVEETYYRPKHGTFSSIGDANYFVNQVIQRNIGTVQRIEDGIEQKISITERFGYRTGREAYRIDSYSEITIRPTFSVRVVLVHDKSRAHGLVIRTAFPMNEE